MSHGSITIQSLRAFRRAEIFLRAGVTLGYESTLLANGSPGYTLSAINADPDALSRCLISVHQGILANEDIDVSTFS